MFEELINHEELFSGASWELGKTHWYILKADAEMNKKSLITGKEFFREIELTEFGKEVGPDEIAWWVFKRETNIQELLQRTQTTIGFVQKLKEDSAALKRNSRSGSYAELIETIKAFADSHETEIHALYDYVFWLHKGDVLAPRMLFSYRVWGNTNLSQRTVEIKAENIDGDQETVGICTELSLGLRDNFTYVLSKVHSDIASKLADSLDPEHGGSIAVPKQEWIRRTSDTVLDEMATYFERIRDSMRNIEIEIKKYNEQMNLLRSEDFWRSLIEKAIQSNRTENGLWDLKETFEMWHVGHKEKEETEVEFCKKIACFANSKGGVLIVGITDKHPRRIVGIEDVENKVNSIAPILKRYIVYGAPFVHTQCVLMKDENGKDTSCLIIAVAQTKGVVSVKDKAERFYYPIRQGAGCIPKDYKYIENSKTSATKDNYAFISDLRKFVEEKPTT